MIYILAPALLFAGAVVKGVLGLGMPMVSIPVLTLFVGLPQALAIVALPVALANIWQAWQFRQSRGGLTFLPSFLATGVLGLGLGTWILTTVPSAGLEIGLGVMVILYLLLRISRPSLALSRRAGGRLATFLGLVSGAMQGATGISGPISITYFNAMRLERPEFIFCAGMTFGLFSALQLPLLGTAGILGVDSLVYGAIGLPAVALGLLAGNLVGRRLNATVFDRLVLLTLVFTAISLLWRGLSETLAA